MKHAKTKAVWSFVLGLLSIVLTAMPPISPLIALSCGVLGLVLSVQARQHAAGTFASAGFVLSIVGIVLAGFVLLFWIQCTGLMRGVRRALYFFGRFNLA